MGFNLSDNRGRYDFVNFCMAKRRKKTQQELVSYLLYAALGSNTRALCTQSYIMRPATSLAAENPALFAARTADLNA